METPMIQEEANIACFSQYSSIHLDPGTPQNTSYSATAINKWNVQNTG